VADHPTMKMIPYETRVANFARICTGRSQIVHIASNSISKVPYTLPTFRDALLPAHPPSSSISNMEHLTKKQLKEYRRIRASST
jgi:hypothetical protein